MSDETFPFVGAFRELGHGSPDGPSLRSAVRNDSTAPPVSDADLLAMEAKLLGEAAD
ncbi:hypothetical protein [Kitasatospora sp. NPDC097691]|uniref:hypothetical protein n=1 Tax=Kitasatospora sp. NPDC097691 TaxID=3157231 RepID=UPI00333107F3